MIITGRQLAAARSLINISQEELAKKAGVGRITIARFENEDTEPRTHIVETLKMTLESLGVEFKDGGVVPKKSSVKEITGEDAFIKLQEDILKDLVNPNQELLFYGANEAYSTKQDKAFIFELKKRKIILKLVTGKGFPSSLSEKDYRFLNQKAFSDNPIIVYGKKVAIVFYNQGLKLYDIMIIENSSMTETFIKILNFIWENADKK